MARKRRFKRSSPDMGWIVVSDSTGFTVPVLENGALVNQEVFTFDDIDELDSVMTKDKSDWFIKRIMVNAYPALERTALETSVPVRLWQMALHTSGDQDALVMQGTPNMDMFNPVWYDHTRRILRTYSRPVYEPWYPMRDNTNGGRQAVTSASGSAPADHELASIQNNWGDAHVRDDFSVSNAGLVPESSLYLTVAASVQGPDWDSGDVLVVAYDVQVLLQKRRGG